MKNIVDINKWDKNDTIYILISIIVSIIFVSVILINYSNNIIKFIFFVVIAVLLFFLLKYLHEVKLLYGNKNNVNMPVIGNTQESNNVYDENIESFSNGNENMTSSNSHHSGVSPVLDHNSNAEELDHEPDSHHGHPHHQSHDEHPHDEHPHHQSHHEHPHHHLRLQTSLLVQAVPCPITPSSLFLPVLDMFS